MATIGAGGGPVFASAAASSGGGGGNPFGGPAGGFGTFSMSGGNTLQKLSEDVSPDDEEEESTFVPVPSEDASTSFAAFRFNTDAPPPEPEVEPTSAPQAQPPQSAGAEDGLRPPSYALGRRTSVSAESIVPTSTPYSKSGGGYPGSDSLSTTEEEPSRPESIKSESQLARIKQAISQNFLFRNLDDEQEHDVLAAMNEVKVGQGEVVIEQGAAGDYFYVIESGEFDIFKSADGQSGDGESEQERKWGKKVFTAVPGGSFGELALMYK